jgi:hypothetical protein
MLLDSICDKVRSELQQADRTHVAVIDCACALS